MSKEIFLSTSIQSLNTALDTRVQAVEFELNLPRHDLHMLVRLSDPKRMGALADEMRVLPSTLTTIADRLEHSGLIRRTRDPEDRRAWLLDLTDEGRALRTRVMATATEGFRALTGLNDEEIEIFANLMQKVMTNMNDTCCFEEVTP
ncbi:MULTISPECIES: MarR family winged helix-turn-helix transcriptional regulator [Roseobacteraceae]|jgi:DNA-binding MarR family transcriptional regulator|uniref:Putative HTH-type transcriptional regulator YusO n=1 Tax=Pseudosulfitobacter pseudonitzschiae TaxID=1402135 RepID=A0A221JWS5_9RHOB|nr:MULTISPECIES: MarR family transcriptional regulator [Roseobacteraceae]ASM71185.1 putative HTH-type transcriptional regulator YusO [Pseudosulfitobacter pseudonitzschiae]